MPQLRHHRCHDTAPRVASLRVFPIHYHHHHHHHHHQHHQHHQHHRHHRHHNPPTMANTHRQSLISSAPDKPAAHRRTAVLELRRSTALPPQLSSSSNPPCPPTSTPDQLELSLPPGLCTSMRPRPTLAPLHDSDPPRPSRPTSDQPELLLPPCPWPSMRPRPTYPRLGFSPGVGAERLNRKKEAHKARRRRARAQRLADMQKSPPPGDDEGVVYGVDETGVMEVPLERLEAGVELGRYVVGGVEEVEVEWERFVVGGVEEVGVEWGTVGDGGGGGEGDGGAADGMQEGRADEAAKVEAECNWSAQADPAAVGVWGVWYPPASSS
ncbi:hypothetical protein EDC01DRAFT_761703 [Geopyxis carbonaria]|nr:hypothetical protein EDC01DRAFT_761703 [Geopyxis carbonaria]